MARAMRWVTMFFFCLAAAGGAQAQKTDRVQSDLSFIWSVPQGAFADNITGGGPGISGSVGGRVPGAPVVLFSELGVLNYGSTDHLELTTFQEQLDDVDVTAPVSLLSIESNSNILMGHLVARLQPTMGVLRPYVDALLGFKYFFTNVHMRSDLAYDWNALEGHTNFDDLTLSLGAGGGLQIQLFTGRLGSDTRSSTISLDLGLRYLVGPETMYLGEDSVRPTDEGLRVDVTRSRTYMLVPKFGLRIER